MSAILFTPYGLPFLANLLLQVLAVWLTRGTLMFWMVLRIKTHEV